MISRATTILCVSNRNNGDCAHISLETLQGDFAPNRSGTRKIWTFCI